VPDGGRPGAPPDARWARAAAALRRTGESLLVAAGLGALAVLLTWPAARRLGTAAHDLGDPLLTTWILAWDLHALATAPLRLFDANMFHPHRWTLAYTDHLLGIVPLALPAHLAGASPLLAHNIAWLLTFPLVGLTAFWLVRALTGHTGAALVAAVLYAFSHFRFGQLGHVQVLSHAGLPLLLLGLHRAATRGARWRDVWLAAGAFALQALSSGYHAVMAVLAVALYAAWLGAPASRPPLGRLVARGALAAGTVVVLLAPAFLPYQLVREEVGLEREWFEVAHYVARPASYLAAPAANRWLGALTAPFRRHEGVLFPGAVVLALAVPAAVAVWRRGRPPAVPRARWSRRLEWALAALLLLTLANWLLLGGFTLRLGPVRVSQNGFLQAWAVLAAILLIRRLVNRRAVPIPGLGWLRALGWPRVAGYYVALTLMAALASLGPRVELGHARVAHPVYQQLRAAVPGLVGLRVPARFGVLVTTGLAVLAGMGTAALARRLPPRWGPAAVLGLGVLGTVEAWSVPLPWKTVPPRPGPAEQWLAARPGGDAVVMLPMHDPRAGQRETLRLFGSIAHWRPLVNGYGGVVPADYPETVALLNTFPTSAAVARLRAIHVGYVVVELGAYPRAVRPAVEAALGALPPGVTRVADLDETVVFEVAAAPPPPDAGAPSVRARRLGRAGGPAAGSGEASGPDERAGAREGGGVDRAAPLQLVEALRDRQHRVEAVALRGQPLEPALLAVDQDDEVLDDQPRRLERLDRLELRGPVGDDVVDHHDALARAKGALHPPPGAVGLLLPARVDERPRARQAGRDREGEARVRDPRDAVGRQPTHLRRDQRPDLGEHVGVGDQDPEVDVEGRGDARLQDELPEADRLDLVEAPDQAPVRRGARAAGGRRAAAHAGISASRAAAAAAGSAAPVTGRPTIR
jgi:hypothetical protein